MWKFLLLQRFSGFAPWLHRCLRVMDIRRFVRRLASRLFIRKFLGVLLSSLALLLLLWSPGFARSAYQDTETFTFTPSDTSTSTPSATFEQLLVTATPLTVFDYACPDGGLPTDWLTRTPVDGWWDTCGNCVGVEQYPTNTGVPYTPLSEATEDRTATVTSSNTPTLTPTEYSGSRFAYYWFDPNDIPHHVVEVEPGVNLSTEVTVFVPVPSWVYRDEAGHSISPNGVSNVIGVVMAWTHTGGGSEGLMSWKWRAMDGNLHLFPAGATTRENYKMFWGYWGKLYYGYPNDIAATIYPEAANTQAGYASTNDHIPTQAGGYQGHTSVPMAYWLPWEYEYYGTLPTLASYYVEWDALQVTNGFIEVRVELNHNQTEAGGVGLYVAGIMYDTFYSPALWNVSNYCQSVDGPMLGTLMPTDVPAENFLPQISYSSDMTCVGLPGGGFGFSVPQWAQDAGAPATFEVPEVEFCLREFSIGTIDLFGFATIDVMLILQAMVGIMVIRWIIRSAG